MSQPSVRDRQDLQLLRRHRTQGDDAARQELVRRYTPFVRSVARHHAGGADAVEELVAVGLRALDGAMAAFDLDRPRRFGPVAATTVTAAVAAHASGPARPAVSSRRIGSRRPRPLDRAAGPGGYRVRVDEPLSALDERQRTVVPIRDGSSGDRPAFHAA